MKIEGKNAVAELIKTDKTIDKILARLDLFYDAYRTQWFSENKPHGFDIQDIRLGGVVRRIEHCKTKLFCLILHLHIF